jgi:tripartite-type tricarboxylate transporter receptor subunit TctC
MVAFRWLFGAVACLLAVANPSGAQSQAYPSKTVRVIVPFGPAGPTDIIARIFAQKLSESLGHQFVVENIGGAGGNTGTAQAAKAAPDGYTILVVSTGFMVNPSLYAKVPYDPIKDFVPLTLVAESPNVMFVHPSVPAKNVKELIDVIKSNPGKYSYAQPALGSTPHLAAELFKLTYNLDLTMVPFMSAGLAVNSVLGGHTPVGFTAVPPTIGPIKDGKLRGLAVLAEKRLTVLPDVPTFAEGGVRDQESSTLTGIVLPAGTPKDIVDRLHQEIVKIGAMPEVRDKLTTLGFIPVLNTPDQFGARIKTEMAKWGKVVQAAKLRIE